MIVNTEELVSRLKSAGVPQHYYCINDEQHESLCILKEADIWRVFLSERGTRYEERKFRVETEACEYFLARILQLWRR
jgi:hypothetical protein